MPQPSLHLFQVFEEILKYKTEYKGRVVILKFGGNLVADNEIIENIARQTAMLRHNLDIKTVIVHGGGSQIDGELKRLRIPVKKDQATGLRITDKKTLEVSDRVMRGINGNVVNVFNRVTKDIRAIGMAGYDARAICADPLLMDAENYTGGATSVDKSYFEHLFSYPDTVPIIYPICYNPTGEDDTRMNVNADEVAGILAAKLDAKRLMLCSDVLGVLDKDGQLIPEIVIDQVDKLIDDEIVTGGMIQKLRTAANVAQMMQAGNVTIVDGRTEGAILAEILSSKGSGTIIRRRPKKHFLTQHP